MLAQEQHDVSVVDIDSDVLQTVEERLDVMAVHGSGTSAAVLDEAGIKDADMLVAVTAIDEVNIIACMMADRLDVPTTIARTRTDDIAHTQSVLKAQDFGIDLVIHPEESAAGEVARLIRRASATDLLTFAEGRLQMVGIRLDEDAPVLGKTLRVVVQEHSEITFRIKAIARDIRTILPRGDERLQTGDQVFVLTRPKYVTPVARILGENSRMRTRLIEPDPEVAADLARDLPDTLVVNCDPTDIDTLVTEGLGDMDAFVSDPLKGQQLPKGILIGAVEHDGSVEIATGTTCIEPGDRAITFVMPDQVSTVEELFAAQR